MSKTGRENYRRTQRELKGTRVGSRSQRIIAVRSVKKNPPDLRKLSRAVIALAMAEMEAEKAAAATEPAAQPADTSRAPADGEANHDD